MPYSHILGTLDKFLHLDKLMEEFLMRTRKTRSDKRKTYIYRYVDGSSIELIAGENGVTEMDIKRLHALDDSEVYYELKNIRAAKTREEKQRMKEWKEEYINKFKSRYGYEPNEADVNYFVKEAFPPNYNLSIDYAFDNDTSIDKSRIVAETATKFEEKSLCTDKMEKVMELMTEKQREVILMLLEGYNQTEIAKKLGISSAGVKKRLDSAKALIKKEYR